MTKNNDKAKPPVGNPNDPLGMAVLLERFLEHLRVKNYSERTVENNQANLTFFIGWAAERSITRPNEVTKPIVERYQRHLYHYVKKDGKPLSFRSQHMKLVAIRTWFKWLTRSNHLLYNPASEIDLPKLGTRLPKHVMSIREAESVLNQANVDDSLGLRDRAILETLYSTGIRRLELIGLSVYDLEVERGTLMIRQGKGKKDRVVPIGERAITWIERYTREVRPTIIVNPNDPTLFLTHLGEPFSTSRLTSMVREYIQKAAIGKKGSCHMFRHTMATLMLENGADVRFIQAMLGHSKLETTQIYTQVSIRKLKEVHDLTHPAKNRREADQASDVRDQTSGEDQALPET
jgi:integrase/recombinase XerD